MAKILCAVLLALLVGACDMNYYFRNLNPSSNPNVGVAVNYAGQWQGMNCGSCHTMRFRAYCRGESVCPPHWLHHSISCHRPEHKVPLGRGEYNW